MRKERVVCDSTVLIAFSSIGRLEILHQLYGGLIIAQEVHEELSAGTGKPGSEISESDWIRVEAVSDPRLKDYLGFNLDRGEAETIALAEEIRADLVLLDDYWARTFAARRHLVFSGTLGILMKAKREGVITVVKTCIDKLIDKGFWIDEGLYKEVLEEAGEM